MKLMEGDLTWGGEQYSVIYRGRIVELYTWNLYHFTSQCHPNKFNKNKDEVVCVDLKLSLKNKKIPKVI